MENPIKAYAASMGTTMSTIRRQATVYINWTIMNKFYFNFSQFRLRNGGQFVQGKIS